MAILKLSRKLTHEKTPHVIFVYAGGHGAASSEKQLFLLNSEDPKYAFFHLEYKLRFIVSDSLSLARIFAVYDCCRVSLRELKGLADGRGN